MSIYQTHIGATIVKCLVTTKINVEDTLYAATAVSLNIVDHLACVKNQLNESTAQGDYSANSKQCPQWEKENKILKLKCENNLSFPKARKQYEQFYTGQTYASAVKPGTCNKSTQTDNKSAQTDDSYTEYLKPQTTAKTQGTQEKHNSSPHPGKSNSSHPGPALKAATLEMMKKDEEKKRKEEKDKLKQQQKEERKQLYLKQQAQRKKEETQNAKQAEKYPFFCVCGKRWRGGHGR